MLFWVIDNAIALAAFVFLAIYFNHWWIALFSILFMSTVSSKPRFHRICDGCGKSVYSYDDIDKACEKKGWIRKKNGDIWEDYCPDCQRKRGIR